MPDQTVEEGQLEHLAFQWISAVCTCGFASTGLSGWATGALLLILVAMTVGASSGSTAGGIKLNRAAWIGKGLVARAWPECMKPGAVLHSDRESIGEDEATRRIVSAALLLVLWLLTLLVGALLLLALMPQEPPLHVLFEAASALGSVGLSSGVTDRQMLDAAKLVLIVLMWMGRLEMTAVFVLLLSPARGLIAQK
jgi:trk system potassium uptake protein TrkH